MIQVKIEKNQWFFLLIIYYLEQFELNYIFDLNLEARVCNCDCD